MFETFIISFVGVFTAYVFIGILFALIFVCWGIQRLDSEAIGSGIGFRLLILPGVTAFWPLFVYRLARGVVEPPLERNSHRDSAT